MKMLMIVVDEARKEELEAVLSEAGVVGYTELAPAAGMGASGPRLGSRAYPRASAVIFSALEEPALADLTAKIRAFCASCGERLRMVAWECEEIL